MGKQVWLEAAGTDTVAAIMLRDCFRNSPIGLCWMYDISQTLDGVKAKLQIEGNELLV